MLLLGKNTARDYISLTRWTRFKLPMIKDFNFPKSRIHTRLLGPCFQTGRIRIIWDIYTSLGRVNSSNISKIRVYAWNSDKSSKQCLLNWFAYYQHFRILFNSLSKVLFIFPSRYLYTKGLPPIISLLWISPHTSSSSIKEHYSTIWLKVTLDLITYGKITLSDLKFDQACYSQKVSN